MALVSAAYLNYLRSHHPHVVKYYLTLIKPSVVYCGTVSGSPDFGARTITVSNVSGNIANIVAGMTVYVGTSCGDYSKSKRRYRSRSGNVLTLDENSVDWDTGDYITVVDSYEYWTIYPYITTEEPFTFYKDRDIPYTNQNLYPNPVAIAGSHKVGIITGASIVFTLDASLSYPTAYGATITGYQWQCTGGTIANSTAMTTTLTITGAGTYWLKLTVTDSNGMTQSTRRIVRVHDADDPPFVKFEYAAPMSQDWDSGGWRTTIDCFDDFDIDDYPDDCIAILWCEQTFKGVEAYYEDNIKLSGYLRRANIQDYYTTGKVSFDIQTINAQMSNSHMYSISLTYSTNPSKWYQYYRLTAARVLQHYFKHHTTLFEVTDVFLPMDEETYMPASDDLDAGSVFEQARNFSYTRSIFANIVVDKHNRVHVRRDIHMLGSTARDAVEELFTVTTADYQPDVEAPLNTEYKLSHVVVSGGRRNPDNNLLQSIISQAPGEVPHNRGSETNNVDYQVLDSQAAGNIASGRVIAVYNRYLEEVRIKLCGNYHDIMDILPQYWITLPAIPNPRNINLAGRYTLKNITTQASVKTGLCLTDIVLQPDVVSTPGIAGPYPPPVDPGGEEPPPEEPPPGWNPPPPPPPVEEDTSDVYVAVAADVQASGNFGDESPNWTSKLGSITGTIVDACKAAWDGSGNVIYILTTTSLWKTEDFQAAFPTWTEVYNITTIDDANFTDKDPQLSRVLTTPVITSRVYLLATALTETGGSETTAFIVRSDDGGETWTSYSIQDGLPYSDYTVTTHHTEASWQGGPGVAPVDTIIERLGDELPTTHNPLAYVYMWGGSQPTGGVVFKNDPLSVLTGGSQDFIVAPDHYQMRYLANENNVVEGTAVLEDYFGTGIPIGIHEMPKDPVRVHQYWEVSGNAGTTVLYIWVFWNTPDAFTIVAADCGKHDGDKVYVGLEDKILRSVDGGITWEDYTTEIGANDIECHPTQSWDDDITVWGSDGRLRRIEAGVLGDSIYLELNPVAIPYRIASDPMTPDTIYALPCAASEQFLLIKRIPGLIESLVLSISGARSLVVTPGATLALRRIYYLAGDDIQYSFNDGITWASKLGDFTGFTAPIRIQPFEGLED